MKGMQVFGLIMLYIQNGLIRGYQIAFQQPDEIMFGQSSWIYCSVKDKPEEAAAFPTYLKRNNDEISIGCTVRSDYRNAYTFEPDNCNDTLQMFNLSIIETTCEDQGVWTCGFLTNIDENTTDINLYYDIQEIETTSPFVSTRNSTVYPNATSMCISPDSTLQWRVNGQLVPEERFTTEYENDPSCACDSVNVISVLNWTTTSDRATAEEKFNFTIYSGSSSNSSTSISTFATEKNVLTVQTETGNLEQQAGVLFKLQCTAECVHPAPSEINWYLIGGKLSEDSNTTEPVMQDNSDCSLSVNHNTYTSTLTTKVDDVGYAVFICEAKLSPTNVSAKSQPFVAIIKDSLLSGGCNRCSPLPILTMLFLISPFPFKFYI